MEDEALRQQFKALQDQQQKKLLKRKQRQEEKNKKNKETSNSGGQEDKGNPPGDILGISDDLGLMVCMARPGKYKFPGNIIKKL